MRIFLRLGLVWLVLLVFAPVSFAQQAQPQAKATQAEFTRNIISDEYVEYRPGNMPLVISVPHGGTYNDESLTRRTAENSPRGFVTILDTNTRPIASSMDSAIIASTGRYPHVIICKVRRWYIDMNRPAADAYPQTDERSAEIYARYHAYMKQACESVQEQFGAGLVLDIHAHGHPKKEIEAGYLLKGSEIDLSDKQLNSAGYAEKTSIRALLERNKKATVSELLRGESAFGTLLAAYGRPTVPSKQSPTTQGEKYFNGGYISATYGSRDEGSVDAIQLELDGQARDKDNRGVRTETARIMAKAAVEFLAKYYNYKP